MSIASDDALAMTFAVVCLGIGAFLSVFYAWDLYREACQEGFDKRSDRLTSLGGWFGGAGFIAVACLFLFPIRINWICVFVGVAWILLYFPLAHMIMQRADRSRSSDTR